MAERDEFEKFKARLQTRPEAFEAFKRRTVEEREVERGGAIRALPPERGFPIGAVGGGLAGALAGTAIAPGPGTIIGGAAGTALGEIGQQAVEVATEDPARPRTASESARRVFEETALGLAGEGIGRVGFGVFKRVAAPFSAKVKPEARQAIELLEPRLTQPLLPAEATETRSLDLLQNVAEASLLGGGAIRDFKVNRTKFMEDLADSFIAEFGRLATPEDAGRAFINSIEQSKKFARLPAQKLYAEVDDLVSPKSVDVTEFQNAPTGILDARGQEVFQQVPLQVTRQVGGAEFSMTTIKEFAQPIANTGRKLQGIEAALAGDSLAQRIIRMPDTVNYADIQALRSRLLSKADDLSITNKGAPAIRVARDLAKLLDAEMERGLQRFDPQSLILWRQANKLWREGSKTFDNRLTRALLRKGLEGQTGEPEAIARLVFRPGGVSRINRVRKAISPTAWKRLQSADIQDLFKKSTDAGGVLNGARLEAEMFGRNGLGDSAMKAAFSPQQVDAYRKFINALKLQQAGPAVGEGRIFIQLAQFGALIDVAGGVSGVTETGFEPVSGTILLGPAVLARLMTNPKSARWLIQGMKVGSRTKTASILAGRILSAAFPRGMARQQIEAQPQRAVPDDVTGGLQLTQPSEQLPDFTSAVTGGLP